jgi:DNA-binding HxlR family transcriptional regulator
MRWRSIAATDCSVARTLAVIGERWTMLIMREAFLGRRRFDDFQRNTGIARNILAARLRALVKHGIFRRTRERDTSGPARVEYRLTDKGLDLYPVLVSLMGWGDRWLADERGPPMTLVHRTCGRRTAPSLVCSACGGELRARETTAIPRARSGRPPRIARSALRAASR